MTILDDRYEVIGGLGRGGMATVYRARDLRHGRDVAVKVMLPGIAESIGAGRFLSEIEIAARAIDRCLPLIRRFVASQAANSARQSHTGGSRDGP